MDKQGSFGYKIGRKIRLMNVQYDADLLWQTCVREIFVLMKHYGSIEKLSEAFKNLKEAKGKPKKEAREKCKSYTDLKVSSQSEDEWHYLTRNCQHSFINILDCGYFVNNHNNTGLVLLLDFNTKSVIFYSKYDKNIIEHDKATIDEIMEFDDMPIKNMTEILTDTKERFEKYNKKLKIIDEEITNIKKIIDKTKELGGEQNIIQKAKELLDNKEWNRRELEMEYRYFYHRLEALNLIDHK